jgi:hypothetical protein
MARDLIPPPSPSGRPSPDAMRETGRRVIDPVEEAQAETTPPEPRGPSPFRSRFGFITGALLGVCVAAIAAFALLLGTSPGDRDGQAGLAGHWSDWFPPSDNVFSGPAAIADHVQTEYKRADGKQLVVVHGGPFLVGSSTSSTQFAVRLQPSDGSLRDLGTDGVFYTLAGAGTGGTITGDKPTPQRERLLRREALELALYSFRYVDKITMFVALLPTVQPKGKAAKKSVKSAQNPAVRALFFRPGDLRKQLQSPLTRTLKPALGLKPGQLAPAEGKRVDALTSGNVFKAHFEPQIDGQLYLVLQSSGG